MIYNKHKFEGYRQAVKAAENKTANADDNQKETLKKLAAHKYGAGKEREK